MKYRTQLLTDQQELVWRLHKEEGMTYRQIAEGLKVSRGRVQQIAAEARRRMKEYEEADPRQSLVLLPTRVRKALEYLDFHSRSELLEAVQSGQLYYDAKEPRRWIWHRPAAVEARSGRNFAHLRNAGRQSWEILLQWLGFPTPADEERRAQREEE